MRYLKMLGLGAMAAAAITASVGAGSASADEICTAPADATNMCPAGKLITTLELSQAGKSTLETTGGTELLSCQKSDLHIDITAQGTGIDPILGTSPTWDTTECSGTVTTINAGSIKATASGTNGSLTSVGAEWTTGILGTTCTYGTGTGTSLGTTSNTSLTVNTIIKKTAGGFLCPSEARWTAGFKITNHNTVDWINN